jgi:UDP-N-acetylglucosamine transferase subunit ALG13
MKIIETEEPDLLLIQDPYEYQNKPAGMEKKDRVFTAGSGKHRAAVIVVNNKIDTILIAQLSDEDTVVLEIVHRKQKFFAASMYFDHEEQIENIFHKMDEIMSFINGGSILIAADCYARSKTWYDLFTNSRGRKLEEYIASKQLHIINEISERSTFHNSRAQVILI